MAEYPNILNRLRRTPWAATPETIESVRRLLDAKIRGRIDVAEQPSVVDSPVRRYQTLFGKRSQAPGDDNRNRRKPYAVMDGVAVVPFFGVVGKHLDDLEVLCGGCDIDRFMSVLREARADPEANAGTVIWFHSPGGVVTGIPEAAREIAAMLDTGPPVWAYTDGMMASAAYWLASQTEAVFAAPSSDVGSIGVFLAWLDMSQNLEDQGIRLELVKAGEHKAVGHPAVAISEEQRAMLQTEVDEIYAMFTSAVVAKRDVPESAMQGQTFSFDRQTANGLVDGQFDSLDSLITEITSAG
jgi:signal peptide peptidase SppA